MVAQKAAALVGLELTDPPLKAARVFHFGLAVSMAQTSALLRRATSLGPVAAGLASGAAMRPVVDEGLPPDSGSAPRTGPTRPPRTCGASSDTWPSVRPLRPSPAAGRLVLRRRP